MSQTLGSYEYLNIEGLGLERRRVPFKKWYAEKHGFEKHCWWGVAGERYQESLTRLADGMAEYLTDVVNDIENQRNA